MNWRLYTRPLCWGYLVVWVLTSTSGVTPPIYAIFAAWCLLYLGVGVLKKMVLHVTIWREYRRGLKRLEREIR